MPRPHSPLPRLDSPRSCEAGAQLDGWLLGPEIGRGGTAVVYRARHATTGVVGAVKVVHAALAFDGEVVSRFLREAQLARRFACCPQVLDEGLVDGVPYVVQELIDGGTLSERLAKGPITITQALEIGEATAYALSTLHREGVVHRDVKPSNIAVRPNGRIVLLDLGIAKLSSGRRETRDGTLLGTPAYAAPEQLLSPAEVDARADIFGLGATLFFALSGSRLREGPWENVVADAILQPPRRLREVAPALPSGVAAAIDKALAFAREDRFETVASFAEALRDARLEAASAPLGTRRTLVGLGGGARSTAPSTGVVARSPGEVTTPRPNGGREQRAPSFRPPGLGRAPSSMPVPTLAPQPMPQHSTVPLRSRFLRAEVLALAFLTMFVALVVATFAAWGTD